MRRPRPNVGLDEPEKIAALRWVESGVVFGFVTGEAAADRIQTIEINAHKRGGAIIPLGSFPGESRPVRTARRREPSSYPHG